MQSHNQMERTVLHSSSRFHEYSLCSQKALDTLSLCIVSSEGECCRFQYGHHLPKVKGLWTLLFALHSEKLLHCFSLLPKINLISTKIIYSKLSSHVVASFYIFLKFFLFTFEAIFNYIISLFPPSHLFFF